MNKLETILRDSGEADNNPLVTEAFGICDSAASIILVGGTCRVTSHPTTILIHGPKLSFAPVSLCASCAGICWPVTAPNPFISFQGVAFNAEQLHHYADTLDQDQHDAAEYYFSNTKMGKEECKMLMAPRDPEKAFTCQQAKEKGIVDVVYGERPLTPRLPPI
jgi:ATP-dependent protease ClpP protease subunit